MPSPINPKGAKSDKIWRDAIMRAVRRLENDERPSDAKPEQRLERLADAIVAKGLGGDVPAMKEIGDRLDGRAHQTAEITHIKARAAELSDDILAGYIPGRSSDGVAETPEDPQIIN